MSAQTFRQLLEESELFRNRVNRFLQAYVNMLGKSYGLQPIAQRLCKERLAGF